MAIFDHRAFMLDVSRDRVPRRETLDWLIGVLAAAEFNELQLYVEHTFAYTGHDAVWRNASALTHDDMRWLDGVGRAAGVTVVANMNGFGHMERWLAHDEYRDLAECPEGFTGIFGDRHRPPTCLEPTAANAGFAVALAREIAGTLSADRIHIGGDEPFELGEGRSADRVAAHGRDHVYLDHLRRIIEPLVADGFDVMFWADLFRRDPALIPGIPPGAIPVVWNYEAPGDESWVGFLPSAMLERLGMPDDANRGFEAHARLFIDAGLPFWVAPGAGGWNTIIGRNRNATSNIADAISVGARNGSPGVLLTEWGDNGHLQPLAVALPSIVRCGIAATSGQMPDDDTVHRRIDEVAHLPAGTGRILDRLGGIAESIGMTVPNGSPVFAALRDIGLPAFGDLDVDGVAAAVETLTEGRRWFEASGFVGHGDVIAEEMRAAIDLASAGLRRLAAEHGVDAAGPPPTDDELDAAVGAQRAAWLRSSRPGGLDDSLSGIRR